MVRNIKAIGDEAFDDLREAIIATYSPVGSSTRRKVGTIRAMLSGGSRAYRYYMHRWLET